MGSTLSPGSLGSGRRAVPSVLAPIAESSGHAQEGRKDEERECFSIGCRLQGITLPGREEAVFSGNWVSIANTLSDFSCMSF